LLSSTFIWKGTWGQNSGTYLHLVGAALEDDHDDAETIMVLLLLAHFSQQCHFSLFIFEVPTRKHACWAMGLEGP